MTPTLNAIRARLREWPICDSKRFDGRHCPKVAVSAVQLRAGEISWAFESRCPDHADPAAPRVCLSCRAENRGRDPWHCRPCATGELPDAGAWAS